MGEQANDFEKINQEFKNFSADFHSKMDSMDGKTSERLSQIETKLETLKTKEIVKKEEDNDFDEDLFGEDKKISKLEKEIRDLKTDLEAKKETDQKKETMTQFQRETAEWDNRAINEFPRLDENSPNFDKEFDRAVIQEVRDTFQPIGKDDKGGLLYPPNAIYDAANRIENRWRRQGKLVDREDIDVEELDHGNPNSHTIKGKKASEVQLEIARKLGIKDEATANKIYEKWNNDPRSRKVRGRGRKM